jgi:two-component system, chemotaxis family, chemotaxis protein CheY
MPSDEPAEFETDCHHATEPLPTKTVLVVDDDALVVDVLSDILESDGYTTRRATSGREAVEVYDAHHPDAVILDVHMPTMDGLTTLDAIRRVDPDARIAMLSGFGQRVLVEEAIEAGARDYILKPVSANCLLGAVAKLVASIPPPAGVATPEGAP